MCLLLVVIIVKVPYAKAENVIKNPEKNSPKVIHFELLDNDIYLNYAEKEYQIKYDIYPEESIDNISFKINNKKYAEISETGLITFKEAGKNKEIIIEVKLNDSINCVIKKSFRILYIKEGLKIDPNQPMVALTFDDGPNSKITTRVLNVLEKYNSKATFFVVGNRLSSKTNQNLLRRIFELGSQIGNHTYSHPNLKKLSEKEILEEINKTNKLIKSAIGISSTVMRPPYGSYTREMKDYVDMRFVLWNIDTLDWKTKDTKSICKEIRNNVKDGSIILMHDLYNTTADAVEIMVPELISQGYQLVTIDELYKYRKFTFPFVLI